MQLHEDLCDKVPWNDGPPARYEARMPQVGLRSSSSRGAVERAGALFGFAHPGAARELGFRDAAVAQLVRLFGPEAASPDDVYIKDWSIDPATADPADRISLGEHPAYRPLPSKGRLSFAGTEVAPEDGGFLEGALSAAEAAHAHLTASNN